MPKRRVSTPRSRAAAAKNLIKARAARSYSHPMNKRQRLAAAYKAGTLPYTPPGFGGRRSKQGGKAYTKKTPGGFKPSAEAQAILAGHQGFRDQTLPEMGHMAGGTPWKPPKSMLKPKKLKPSEMHGSGTGLSSAYRYLPTNVAKRKKGKK